MNFHATAIHLHQPSFGYGMEACAANHGVNSRWSNLVTRKASPRPDEIVIG